MSAAPLYLADVVAGCGVNVYAGHVHNTLPVKSSSADRRVIPALRMRSASSLTTDLFFTTINKTRIFEDQFCDALSIAALRADSVSKFMLFHLCVFRVKLSFGWQRFRFYVGTGYLAHHQARTYG